MLLCGDAWYDDGYGGGRRGEESRGEETLRKEINESWSLVEETRLIISRFNKQIAWEVTLNSCSFVAPLSRQWPIALEISDSLSLL